MSRPVYFFLLAVSWFGSAFIASWASGQERPAREVAIHEMLLELKPWHEDIAEPPEERFSRLRVVAEAIAEASLVATNDGTFGGGREELEVLLVTVAWWETRLASRIHAGNCHKHECDHGRARGLTQVQLSTGVPRELWENAVGQGYEPTLASMRAASFALGRAYARCFSGDRWHRVFGAYARGTCSATYQVHERSQWFQRRLRDYRKRLAGAAAK